MSADIRTAFDTPQFGPPSGCYGAGGISSGPSLPPVPLPQADASR